MADTREGHFGALHLFAEQALQRRIETLLSRKRRDRIRQMPAHNFRGDDQFRVLIQKGHDEATSTYHRLIELRAPKHCYLISESRDLDDDVRELDLKLIEVIIGSGQGALISCIPGRLAYYAGEERNDRYIIRRPERAAS